MYKLLLIGAGHMGGSLLNGWINSNFRNIHVIDPNFRKKKIHQKIKVYKSILEIPKLDKFDILFFAVKPQIVSKVINSYNNISLKNKLIISIIAGKKTKYFENQFNQKINIIRTMPNLPASVGKGVTCLYANKYVNFKQKKFTERLFKSVGSILWVNKENYIDKITALSGSGPAYYYYFIECLTKAGIKIGLNKKLSYILAKETAIGSISLLKKTGLDSSLLRKRIAVKGGTTEAGINRLQKNNNMEKIIFNAVNSAFKRSQQIGKKKD